MERRSSVASPRAESKASSLSLKHTRSNVTSFEEKPQNPEIEAQVNKLIGPDEQNYLMIWYLALRDMASHDPSSVLQDEFATHLLYKIKKDIGASEMKRDGAYFKYTAARTKQLDDWTRDFIKRHQYEDSLVLQLSCGMDNRYARVCGGKDVRWIDVDSPRIIAVRERMLPIPHQDYELLAALVGGDDDAWLQKIPSDRPVLIVMESLLYYFEPDKGMQLIKRLLHHFPRGSIICDTFGSVAVTFTALIPSLRGTNTALKWGLDDAEDLKKLDSRLVLRDRVYSHEYLSAGWFAKGYPPMFGGWTPLISLSPKVSLILNGAARP